MAAIKTRVMAVRADLCDNEMLRIDPLSVDNRGKSREIQCQKIGTGSLALTVKMLHTAVKAFRDPILLKRSVLQRRAYVALAGARVTSACGVVIRHSTTTPTWVRWQIGIRRRGTA